MSGDLVARLRLEASPGNTAAVLGGVKRDVAAVGPAGQAAASGLRQAETAATGFERSASGARGAASALGGAMAALGLREVAGQIKDAAFQVQGLKTGLEAVTGGSAQAADAQAYITEQSGRLGLVVRDQTDAYLKLAAATNGTALQGKATKDIWLGLVQAGAALNLTSDKQANAMLAISQIASKGVVQQEDLRGQLAEALPGALQVAQRALGKYGQEFDKAVASGKLMADDFLPKLAAQLNTEFGSRIDASLTTPIGRARVELAEFKNTTDSLQATAGAAFLTGLTSGLATLNDELREASAQEIAKALGQDLGQGLAIAAQGAAFLVDHLQDIQTAAAAVVGIALSKWLVTSATEARVAAAAYLAKGAAAQGAGAMAVTAAEGEANANIGLRAAVEAAARAELQGAVAARDLALANEQAAAATLAQARAEASALTSTLTLAEKRVVVATAERELTAAQLATANASARAELAAGTLAKATTLGGAAAQGAKTVFSSLMALLGGPWGVALLSAGAAVGSVTAALAENKRIQEDVQRSGRDYAATMRDVADYLGPAAAGSKLLGQESLAAVAGTNALTDSVRGLANETYRLASARGQTLVNQMKADANSAQQQIDKIDNPGLWTSIGRGTLRFADSLLTRQPLFDWAGDKDRAEQRAILERRMYGSIGEATAFAVSAKANTADPVTLPKTSTTTSTGKADKAELKAQDRSQDLEASRIAQEQYTKALLSGGAALDEWNIKEAGRQAVERLALADRPKLTAAEEKLVAQIRNRAEETERLKIANDRVEKALGLKKTADDETKALKDRSTAAAQGEAALEALQVKEAGLEALQRIGVDTLDQLTGATRDHVKAAMDAAEAKEKQAIATAKAERVAATLRDLDDRTASEKAYAIAVAGGTEALVAYQREEFERQEIERAGKTLTDDQVAAIKAKADALFAAKAAADSADLNARFAEELRLSQLTNQERAIEERYLQRKSLLLAEHVDWTKEEVEARARALALADEAAAQDAKAKGDLKEGLKQAFIESGHLGFEDVGDFVERRLREAVYNALLAKPIDILVNAVVGSLSTGSIMGGGGLGAGSTGVAGIGSLFNSAGGLAGLTTSSANLATSLLSKAGMSGWNAAKFGGMAGGAIGGAGTGMLVSGLASALGIKQTSGSKIGSTLGGAIGSFIPIPGGAILGSIAGNLIGSLIGGKESNHAAVASLDSTGKVTSIGGAKRTDATTQAAQQVADAVAQIQAALVAGGATLNATVSQIDIGTRDSTHLNFSNGASMDTAVGDVSAAIEAATKTILANAKWQSEAQTAYAQKLLAAGATIDEVIATMQVATNFAGNIDDAIAQLTDPAAYAKKQALAAIDANYQALKAQAQELITAGLATQEVLGKIDQLKDLQVDEALKRLAAAADGAASALAPADFQASIADQIAQLLDPVGYERAKALAEIDANYVALKAQAQALVDAGKLSADVLTQLDQLKGLQVADSVAKLGDAASDAAQALAAAADAQAAANDFAAGIDDAILQLTNPMQAKVNAITRDYEAKVAQAVKMIAAGTLDADALSQLAVLKDLQLQDLADGVADAASAFADAKPRLQQWLDSLAVGANSPLNPAAQKDAAQATYDRLLALARTGDADALSQITGAGDSLMSADRNATSSASERLALFNKIQSDIQGLANMTGVSAGQSPEVTQLAKVNKGIEQLVAFNDPELLAVRPPPPVEVAISPWLETTLRDQGSTQTAVMKELLEKVVVAVDQARNAITNQIGSLTMETRDGLGALRGQLGNVGGLAEAVSSMATAVEDLTSETRSLNASVRVAVINR